MKKYVTGLLSIFTFLFLFFSISKAQTTYKNDSGVFASLESLYLRGGSFEDAQLIGPAFGYRFNENYDVSLHTELLFSEQKFSSRENGNTSLLNLGLTFGHTARFSNPFMVRSELSLYKSFNFNVEGFDFEGLPEIPDPSLNSALGSSSFYVELPLSNTISLLPNAGGFLGYGEYDAPISDAELTQGFDGFVAGPDLGLDFLFAFSDSFSMAITPSYRHHLTDNAPYDGEFSLNFQFNF
jgi:hypothetical protein